MRDTAHHLFPAFTQRASAKTADQNGTGVDLQGYEAAVAIFQLGTWTDGTHTPILEESDDNSSFTLVAAADRQGAFTAVTSNANVDTVQKVGYVGNKRYLRVRITAAGTTTGMVNAAIVVRSKARHIGTIA